MDALLKSARLVAAANDAALNAHLELHADLKVSTPVPESSGATLLHIAASRGHLAVARALLERGADLEALDEARATPLLAAVGGSGPLSSEHHAVILELLARGANPDVADVEGLSPLHEASNNGDEPALRALLSAGAPVNKLSMSGTGALHFVAAGGARRPDLYGALGVKEDATLQEIKRSRDQLALVLHPDKRRTSSNTGDDDADIARRWELVAAAYAVLHDPVSRDVYDNAAARCAQLLLQHGADSQVSEKEQVSSKVDTPFVLAVRFKQWGVALAIDVHCASSGSGCCRDRRGRTLLHHLVVCCESESRTVDAVLTNTELRQIELIARDEAGQTPFHLACAMGDVSAVRSMLEAVDGDGGTTASIREALIASRADDGSTALIAAVRSGSDVIARMLLDQGADVNVADGGGETAHGYAAMYGDMKELAELLRSME